MLYEVITVGNGGSGKGYIAYKGFLPYFIVTGGGVARQGVGLHFGSGGSIGSPVGELLHGIVGIILVVVHQCTSGNVGIGMGAGFKILIVVVVVPYRITSYNVCYTKLLRKTF